VKSAAESFQSGNHKQSELPESAVFFQSRAFFSRVSGIWALQRNADRAPQTTSTSPPSELAANRLGGELYERKSHCPQDLRLRNKLAAK
jgi:hypothetical protein